MFIKTIIQKITSCNRLMASLSVMLFMLLMAMQSCTLNTSNSPMPDQSIEGNFPEIVEYIATPSQDSIDVLLEGLHNCKLKPYTISSGDRFKVFVYDEPDLDLDLAIVKSDGTLSMRLIGEVEVAGLGISDAASLIEDRLRSYILHPKVSLILIEPRKLSVSVLGKVTHPGNYEINGSMSLLDAISTAGGFALGQYPTSTVELADLEKAYLVRGHQVLPIDFVKLVIEGDTRYNIPLLDGDYIFVPTASSREIYVLGEVNLAGHFFYDDTMTALKAIAIAQGMKNTATRTIYVIRGNLQKPHLFKINTGPILHAKAIDFPLEPNDIIYVPKNPLAKWNDVVTLIMPSLQAIQSAWFANSLLQDIGTQ